MTKGTVDLEADRRSRLTTAELEAEVGGWDNMLHGIGVTRREAEVLRDAIDAAPLGALGRLREPLDRILETCRRDEERATSRPGAADIEGAPV